ncbi:MAG: ABC transporter permease [Vicinamibacterales bacterium]
MMRALHLVEHNARAYRRAWARSVVMTFVQPALMLAAMGLGLGSLVDSGGAMLDGAASYLAFLAPGLLAATCMQTASMESSFPINGRLNWHASYLAIAATPMRVVDIVLGEVMWVALRLMLVATAFTAVSVAFGVPLRWGLVAAIPAAVLTGLAFSAPIVAYSGLLTRSGNYNVIFRFVITPLFLFSGVYFPVTRMPVWLQHLAAATPLYHGIALTRGLSLGTLTWTAAAPHVAYLAIVIAVGMMAAVVTFTRKLRP